MGPLRILFVSISMFLFASACTLMNCEGASQAVNKAKIYNITPQEEHSARFGSRHVNFSLSSLSTRNPRFLDMAPTIDL